MKKLLLASAVAALSITAAQAAPTVYGKVYLTLDLQDGNKNSSSKDSRSQLKSNASRLGIKGSENLTANTDLVYQLEYRLDVDTHGKRNWESRDTYLGLAHKQYGTLVAGRLSAIDGYVDYANVATGGVVGGSGVLASFDAERANNTFAYFSPEYNGVQFMGMYTMDEMKKPSVTKKLEVQPNGTVKEVDVIDVTGGGNDSFGRDVWGVGAKYEPENAPVKAGVSYIQAGDFKAARLSGAYAVNPALTAGALYQYTKHGKDSKNESAFTVSANYKVAQTPWTAYGQIDVVDNAGGDKNHDKQRLVVGGKYAFNKNTTGHVYSGYLKDKVKTGTGAKVNADSYGIGGGIEYKF